MFLVVQLWSSLGDPMDCNLPFPVLMKLSRQNTGVRYHALLQGIFLTQNEAGGSDGKRRRQGKEI